MSAKQNKGKVSFDKEDSKWGYIKGTVKWAKVLEADDYGHYSLSLYVSDEEKDKYVSIVSEVANYSFNECTSLGINPMLKEVTLKEDKEGNEYIGFKLEAVNSYTGDTNHLTFVDKYGNTVHDWNKLIGNGSTIKVKYRAKPYCVNKNAGAGVRMFAIQIIDLVEYTSGSSNGFSDESESDEF